MKDLKFYVCTHCGNLIETIHSSGVPMICCGEPMKELVPNTVEAAGEKHKPVIAVEGSTVTVTVGSVAHPMTDAHLIQWVVLETEQGGPAQDPDRQTPSQGCVCPGRGRQGGRRLCVLQPARPVEDRSLNQRPIRPCFPREGRGLFLRVV